MFPHFLCFVIHWRASDIAYILIRFQIENSYHVSQWFEKQFLAFMDVVVIFRNMRNIFTLLEFHNCIQLSWKILFSSWIARHFRVRLVPCLKLFDKQVYKQWVVNRWISGYIYLREQSQHFIENWADIFYCYIITVAVHRKHFLHGSWIVPFIYRNEKKFTQLPSLSILCTPHESNWIFSFLYVNFSSCIISL